LLVIPPPEQGLLQLCQESLNLGIHQEVGFKYLYIRRPRLQQGGTRQRRNYQQQEARSHYKQQGARSKKSGRKKKKQGAKAGARARSKKRASKRKKQAAREKKTKQTGSCKDKQQKTVLVWRHQPLLKVGRLQFGAGLLSVQKALLGRSRRKLKAPSGLHWHAVTVWRHQPYLEV
jgi:hypothetical protein